jgi:hypothetical protein
MGHSRRAHTCPGRRYPDDPKKRFILTTIWFINMLKIHAISEVLLLTHRKEKEKAKT